MTHINDMNSIRSNTRLARALWPEISRSQIRALCDLAAVYNFSVARGDIIYLDDHWYVTSSGLLRLAQRQHCASIQVRPLLAFCDFAKRQWVFRATVFKTRKGGAFVSYGDADPSNVAALVRGAEMRVAETRAVNRALRRAYAVAACSVEELGSSKSTHAVNDPRYWPSPANGNGNGSPKVRDRFCQLIRRHRLDPSLVKSYAVDFCGTKTLRDATREQIEAFVVHLSDWAEKDRNALLCQLNSYLPSPEKEVVADKDSAGAA